eukprot:364647-Chlamydomonas_euryale.AAC.17
MFSHAGRNLHRKTGSVCRESAVCMVCRRKPCCEHKDHQCTSPPRPTPHPLHGCAAHDVQVALGKADELLDMVAAGVEPGYDSVRERLADQYAAAGLTDVANFIRSAT